MHQKAIFAPLFTSIAGQCLTPQNWHEIGVNIAAFSLAELLIKPGVEVLQNIPNLATYVGWDKFLLLDARLPVNTKKEKYEIRSAYDGRRHHFDFAMIIALINRLKPTQVFANEGLSSKLFSPLEVGYAISDKPAQEGYNGKVYSQRGDLVITDIIYAQEFTPIDAHCHCPTCRQAFSRAYLHHLYFHTPLLCQRLLIQHNVYAVLNSRYDVPHN